MTAKSSTAVDLQYDAHGAAVYVCAVISVYALFVVVFVAILFAVRRRRHSKMPLDGDVDGAGRLGGYLVNVGRQHDVGVLKPPQPARLRSDSSSSVSPVRRSSRARRGRSVAAGSAGNRGRWRVDELLVPPCGRSTNDTQSRRAVRASPIDDVITLIQVEGSELNARDSVTSDVTMLTSSTGTASTSASTIDVSSNRCRWSTGSNGDIWVLQIEPDDGSSTAKLSPKHSYSALPSDDIGPDGQSTRSPSVVSMPRADEMPTTMPSASSSGASSLSSSSSSATAGNDRSTSALVDLSVAHVIKCCRQPPWDQLLPTSAAGTRHQSYAEMEYQLRSRRASGNVHSWRRSSHNPTAVQSPAELQRLLHVTSV